MRIRDKILGGRPAFATPSGYGGVGRGQPPGKVREPNWLCVGLLSPVIREISSLFNMALGDTERNAACGGHSKGRGTRPNITKSLYLAYAFLMLGWVASKLIRQACADLR